MNTKHSTLAAMVNADQQSIASYASSATFPDDDDEEKRRELEVSLDLEAGYNDSATRRESATQDIIHLEDFDNSADLPDHHPKNELEQMQLQARLMEILLKKYNFDGEVKRRLQRTKSAESLNPMSSTMRKTRAYSFAAPPDADTLAHQASIQTPDDAPTSANVPQTKLDASCYIFGDVPRAKVVDFVLAYQPRSSPSSKDSLRDEIQRRKYRQIFESAMRDVGLEIEHDRRNAKVHFTKIHATWEFLSRQADLMQVKVPIAPVDIETKNPFTKWSERIVDFALQKLSVNPFRLPSSVQAEKERYYHARFDSKRQDMFSISDRRTFFTPVQRIRMVANAIWRINATRGSEVVSYFWLRQEGIYSAGFPLHDSDVTPHVHEPDPFADVPQKELPRRRWLYANWANFRAFYRYQPLDEICEYFDTRVAFYFAWIGYYTNNLYLPAFVGFICFFFGVIHLTTDRVTGAYCDTSGWGNVTACRDCLDPFCRYKRLSDTCNYARLSHIFDNYATVIFAFFITIWAVVFVERWKRRQMELAAHWHAADREFQDVLLRPQFQLRVSSVRKNPITRQEELYLSRLDRLRRLSTSVAAVSFFVLFVVALIIGLVIYRLLSDGIYQRVHAASVLYTFPPSVITSVTASVFNGVVILIMSSIYSYAARWLTEFEYPRTEEEYALSYTYKVFAFQFVNFYGSLFYLSFFKGKFAGSMNENTSLSDRCPPSGCMAQICIQLIIIMSGKQFLNSVKEMATPYVKNWLTRRRHCLQCMTNSERCHKDFALSDVQPPAMFDDYLEMVLQYGFLVMFASAFPLAAVFALLNNIVEIRIDANKLLTQHRRPIPENVQSIGPWLSVLELLTKLAVLTNAFVIAFTSDFVDRLYLIFKFHATYPGADPDTDKFGDYYMNHTFTTFNTNDYPSDDIARLRYDEKREQNVSLCYYRGYYERADASNKYERTYAYTEVLVARLAFIVFFQNAVSLLLSLIQYLIKPVPTHVAMRIERERHIAQEMFLGYELRSKMASPKPTSTPTGERRRPSNLPNRLHENGLAADNTPSRISFNMEMDASGGSNSPAKQQGTPNVNQRSRRARRQGMPVYWRILHKLGHIC